MLESDNILSKSIIDTDKFNKIRPSLLNSYIGQKNVKEQLDIFIKASLSRKEPLDHTLLYGPPGLGKTTLAQIIANELGVNLKQTSGPVIEKSGDLVAILTNLEENDVLFIDEIHRLSPNIEEVLYPAMEDYRIDIIVGEGPSAKSIKIDIPPFTLVSATTRAGLLTSPLRDRFGIIQRLEYYEHDDLSQIVLRSAKILNFSLSKEAAFEIAKRARGTPRIANRILKRVRDYALVKSVSHASENLCNDALNMLSIDKFGLDIIDRKLLNAMKDMYDGGPVGLDSIAASIGEDAGTIEEVVEPYLLQINMITRTSRGRVLTNTAYKHLELKK